MPTGSSDSSTTTSADAPSTVVQDARRLSASHLWQLQRNFYSTQGSAAFTSGGVPSFITTNCYIASRYVDLALAFLRDHVACFNTAASTAEFLPPPKFYIIELGAGAGKFAFNFLKGKHTAAATVAHMLLYLLCDAVLTSFPLLLAHLLL